MLAILGSRCITALEFPKCFIREISKIMSRSSLAVEAFVLWSISAYHRDIFNYLRITLHQVDERTRIYIYDGYNYDVWIFAFFVGMIGIVINQELQWKGKFVVSFVFVLMHICLMFLRYSIVPWNK